MSACTCVCLDTCTRVFCAGSTGAGTGGAGAGNEVFSRRYIRKFLHFGGFAAVEPAIKSKKTVESLGWVW